MSISTTPFDSEYAFKGETKLQYLPNTQSHLATTITITNVEAVVSGVKLGVIALALRHKKGTKNCYIPEMKILDGEFLPWQVVANGDALSAIPGHSELSKDCSKDQCMAKATELMELYESICLRGLCEHTLLSRLSSENKEDMISIKKIPNTKPLCPVWTSAFFI